MPRACLNFTPSRMVSAADILIAGDVLRIVLDGIPKLRARSPMEALNELRAEHEDFRRFVIEPPRGHEGIDACLLLPPFSSGAVRTAVIAEHFGYAPVAGTLLLASAVALIETGHVAANEPLTSVIFDTAHGKTEVVAAVKDGRCQSLRWFTTLPGIVADNHSLVLENGHSVPATLVASGLPFVVARAMDLGVSLLDTQALGAAGAMLSRAAGKQMSLRELDLEQDLNAYLVMIIDDPTQQGHGDAAQIRAACVTPNGNVARMPTGTGTLSVAAHLIHTGQLAPGQKLEVTSPTGHTLSGWIDSNGASIEGTAQLVSLAELVGD